MNTLKLLFTLSTLVITLTANAQLTGNPEIQKRLDSFIELTNQKKYNEAFDLMYPKMFNRVAKQELVNLMTSMNNDGLSVNVSNRRITSFSSPFSEGNETFVRIQYSADMAIDMAKGSLYDSPKASQAIMQQFETTYGTSNVKWDADTKRYTILAHKAMMAIQQDGKDWYLVEINTDEMDLMKSLFSEAVMDALVLVE